MGMLSINTNIGALKAADAAYSVNKSMETSMQRLSTGKRINSAIDDAAGLQISQRQEAEIRGFKQATKNAADSQALLATAEGAMGEITNILQRMRELAVQSASGTMSTADRTALQSEVEALETEIDRIKDEGETPSGIVNTVSKTGRTIFETTATTCAGLSAGLFVAIPGLQNFFILMMLLLVLALLTSSILLPSIITSYHELNSRLSGKGTWLDYDESGSVSSDSSLDAVLVD